MIPRHRCGCNAARRQEGNAASDTILDVSADGRTLRATQDGPPAAAAFGGPLAVGRCHRLSLGLQPRDGQGHFELGAARLV
jgi:hypothetical protein